MSLNIEKMSSASIRLKSWWAAPRPRNASCPNRSYWERFSASERISYASAHSLNFASASLSSGLRSGWYFIARRRYARLISSASEDFSTPRTS
jgi:hypothetical protein